jgi:hypothetical protein
VATQATQGNDLVLSGKFSRVKVVYLSRDRDLGTIVDISNGMSQKLA